MKMDSLIRKLSNWIDLKTEILLRKVLFKVFQKGLKTVQHPKEWGFCFLALFLLYMAANLAIWRSLSALTVVNKRLGRLWKSVSKELNVFPPLEFPRALFLHFSFNMLPVSLSAVCWLRTWFAPPQGNPRCLSSLPRCTQRTEDTPSGISLSTKLASAGPWFSSLGDHFQCNNSWEVKFCVAYQMSSWIIPRQVCQPTSCDSCILYQGMENYDLSMGTQHLMKRYV